MHLKRADRRDDDDRIRFEAGHAALDVQELLGPQVPAESGLRDQVVGQLQAQTRRLDAVAPVGDVGEGPTVDEGGRALERLDQVRLDGILQQSRHGTGGADVPRRDGLAVVGVGQHHPGEPGLQIHQVHGEAEDRHDLGGHRDVESALARDPLGTAAQADDHLAQGTLVQVHHAAEHHAAGIDVQFVALLEVVVQHRGAEVVGRGDGVQVPGKVEVDVLHRDHLGVAAPRRTALDPETGAQGGLAQSDADLFADLGQSIGQAHARRGLALARRRRGYRRHEDKLSVRLVLEIFEDLGLHLGLVLAVELKIIPRDPQLLRNLRYGAHLRSLGNFDVARYRHHSTLHSTWFCYFPRGKENRFLLNLRTIIIEYSD